MSATTFLLAFRRFISRRGIPSTIYSDNASLFHCFARVLTAITSAYLQNFVAQHMITWKFNVLAASWWGGWWERIIRIIKYLLKGCLGRRSLKFEELTTVLHEVEAITNCRALTYLSSDSQELQLLTPSRFQLAGCPLLFSCKKPRG